MKMKMKTSLPKFLLAASATGLLALAAVLPAQADYSNTVMSLNPVAYWRLNEPVAPALNYGSGTATNLGSLGAVANGVYYHSPLIDQARGPTTNDTSVLLNINTNTAGDQLQYIDVPYSPVLNTNGPFSVSSGPIKPTSRPERNQA